MARQFFTAIDLNKNELRQGVVHLLGSDPGSPTEGQIWYNTASHVPKIFNGTSNLDLTNPTQLNGQLGSYYLSRTNHTGTQLAATISDFNTAVRLNPPNLLTTPTADFAMGSFKITGLANGTVSSDAINLGQLNAAIQGFSWKTSVRVASTANITVSNPATAVFDGITLSNGQRILLKNQTTQAENGIYIFNGSGSALTRATDADTAAELENASVFVDEGTANSGTAWNQTAEVVTLGTTGVTWVQFAGGGAYTATAPVTLTGNAFGLSYTARFTLNANALELANVGSAGTYTQVTTDAFGRVTAGADMVTANGIVAKTAAGTFTSRTITGTAARITLTNGDGVAGNPTIDIASTYVGQGSITTLGTITTGIWAGTNVAVANGGTGSSSAAGARTNLGATGKYSALIGDGVATTITITQATHGLATSSQNHVQVFDASSGLQIECDVAVLPANGNVTLTFSVAPASNAYRVVIIG